MVHNPQRRNQTPTREYRSQRSSQILGFGRDFIVIVFYGINLTRPSYSGSNHPENDERKEGGIPEGEGDASSVSRPRETPPPTRNILKPTIYSGLNHAFSLPKLII